MALVRPFLAGLGAAALGLATWGAFIEPRWLEITRFRTPLPHLPPSWHHKKIAVLSDFQIGTFRPNQTAAFHAVHHILRSDVDLMLFAGDFVYKAGHGDPHRAVEILRPIVDAGIPTFAVLGNHDYRLSLINSTPDTNLADEIVAVSEAAGIRVLRNEHVAIPAPDGGAPLMLVGVDSEWSGFADIEQAFAEVSPTAPRVVLVHNPATFLRIPPKHAPLALAGHTHGGQIRPLPFVHEIRTLKDTFIVDGWGPRAHGDDGNRLYVNRGIGYSWMPVRIGARPELTILELIPTNSDATPSVEQVMDEANETSVAV